jgi:hypothetical protein
MIVVESLYRKFHYKKYIIDNIRSVHMNFTCGFVAKITLNTNNWLKQLLLMHWDGVLPKNIVIESFY